MMENNKEYQVYDKSRMHIENGEAKECFCVGPENCNDLQCELVKKHKEKLKG